MDKGKVPAFVHHYISELENSDGLVLTFQIYKNLNSNKIVLQWQPVKEVSGHSQPVLRTYRKPSKSPGQLKRDQRRRAEHLERQASRITQCENAGSGRTSQLSHLENNLEHKITTVMKHSEQSQGHQRQVSTTTPLSSQTNTEPSVFSTPSSPQPGGAVGGVAHDVVPSCVDAIVKDSVKNSKTPKTVSSIKKDTCEHLKDVHTSRKDSLRSQRKNECKVSISKEDTIDKFSYISKYNRNKGTVELKVCSRCVFGMKELGDCLECIRSDHGMTLDDGDSFTYMCSTCQQLQTISDPAILYILQRIY